MIQHIVLSHVSCPVQKWLSSHNGRPTATVGPAPGETAERGFATGSTAKKGVEHGGAESEDLAAAAKETGEVNNIASPQRVGTIARSSGGGGGGGGCGRNASHQHVCCIDVIIASGHDDFCSWFASCVSVSVVNACLSVVAVRPCGETDYPPSLVCWPCGQKVKAHLSLVNVIIASRFCLVLPVSLRHCAVEDVLSVCCFACGH